MKVTPHTRTILREHIADLIERNFDRLQEDIDRMPERDRVKALLELMKYVIAPYKAAEEPAAENRYPQMPTEVVFKVHAPEPQR